MKRPMWIYKIEKPHRNPKHKTQYQYIDIPFASSYELSGTHLQRLATVFRVPLFEGFAMPSSDFDSETASMYLQLLLRPLAVSDGDEPRDVREKMAFSLLCPPTNSGVTAFTTSWQQYEQEMQERAIVARTRFLDRYEMPSIWETEEVQKSLHEMYLRKVRETEAKEEAGDAQTSGSSAAWNKH